MHNIALYHWTCWSGTQCRSHKHRPTHTQTRLMLLPRCRRVIFHLFHRKFSYLVNQFLYTVESTKQNENVRLFIKWSAVKQGHDILLSMIIPYPVFFGKCKTSFWLALIVMQTPWKNCENSVKSLSPRKKNLGFKVALYNIFWAKRLFAKKDPCPMGSETKNGVGNISSFVTT